MILRAALRNPKVAKLSSVQHKKGSGDLVKWFADRLQVSFPGKSEIMEVSLRTDDGIDAPTLLNAVVDAYMSEVVNAERDRMQRRYDELDIICNDKEQELRTGNEKTSKAWPDKWEELIPKCCNMRQKLIFDEIALLQTQLAKATFEVNRYKVDLAVQRAYLADAKDGARDPIVKEIKRLQVTIDVTGQQNATLAKKIKELGTEAVLLSAEPVDLQMIRDRIKNLTASLSKFAAEKDRLRVELRATPRVTLMEPAE